MSEQPVARGASCSDERLTGDLAAEHSLAVLVGGVAPEDVDLDGFEVEKSDEVVQGRLIGGAALHDSRHVVTSYSRAMTLLDLSADDVLTTTRSVRKRLDFDRPVERATVLESLQAIRRAGADFIFTYFAVQAAKYLREG